MTPSNASIETSIVNNTRELIDHMIDEAQEDNLLASYVILIGHAPQSSRSSRDDLAWLRGHKSYRHFTVAQSGEIPFEAILLSPTADNYQVGEVNEYKGLTDSGRVVRRTLYR